MTRRAEVLEEWSHEAQEIIVKILVVGATLMPVLAVAQQRGKVAVGFISAGPAPTLAAPDPLFQTFLQGLAAHGYVDGGNVAIETRWAGGRSDQLPALAAELVGLKVNVIVAGRTVSSPVLCINRPEYRPPMCAQDA